jgi:RimJ/RimL family protein N-acetyltransferase
MLAEILAHSFGPLDLQRVELGVFSQNASAVRLYERLGFHATAEPQAIEGMDGNSWCVLEMRLTKTDWLAASPH